MEPTVDYEELERLEKEASEAPWGMYDGWGPSACDGRMRAKYIGTIRGAGRVIEAHDPSTIAGCVDLIAKREDFEFVVRARSAVPVLLSERRRLHRALEIATEALKCLHWYDGLSCDDAEPGPGVPCTACAAREAVKRAMEQED